MDLPNLTLFVQMGNFAIAYCLLRKYIFAPALNIILAQESRIESLNKKIDIAYMQQQQILMQQKTQWHLMKDSLGKLVPDFSIKLCKLGNSLSEPIVSGDIKLTDPQKKVLHHMLQDELLDVKI